MRTRPLSAIVALLAVTLTPASPAAAQDGARDVDGGLPPAGYGSLSQSDLALRLRNDEIEIRFVPLDQRVTRLLAGDAFTAAHVCLDVEVPGEYWGEEPMVARMV